MFTIDGILFLILAISLISITFLLAKPLRKIANTYWFWLSIGVIYLVISIVFEWTKNWSIYSHMNLVLGKIGYYESIIISKAHFLNLCMLVWFLFPIFLIIDPSRKVARLLAPFAIICSIPVLFADIPFNSNIKFNWYGIFFGPKFCHDLYFFFHMINMLLGIGVLLNTPRQGWKFTIGTYGLVGTMYLYIGICVAIFHPILFVSGLSPNDFKEGGVYGMFETMFHMTPGPSAALFFTCLILVLLGVCILFDLLKSTKWFYYGDRYSGTWWHWYDYQAKSKNTQVWGWFSKKWQVKHPYKNYGIEALAINAK